jgi:hypothetical protein
LIPTADPFELTPHIRQYVWLASQRLTGDAGGFSYEIGDIDAADFPSRIEGGRHEGVLGLFQLHLFRCRSRNLKATHIAGYGRGEDSGCTVWVLKRKSPDVQRTPISNT